MGCMDLVGCRTLFCAICAMIFWPHKGRESPWTCPWCRREGSWFEEAPRLLAVSEWFCRMFHMDVWPLANLIADTSVQSEKLSSSASAPPRLQPATNTNLPRDASAFPGRGDTLKKSARHPDFTSHPSSVHPCQSCSFGVLEDSSLSSFLFNTEAETEGSQVVFAQDVAQSNSKQKADAPAAVSIQPCLTNGKTESFHEQAEINREELKR